MFSKKNYINLVSLILLGMVSFLFMVKYSARVTAFPVLFSGLFLLVFYLLVTSLDKIDFVNHKFFNLKTFFIISVLLSFALIIGLNFISTETRVGRYIAIKSWLDNLQYGFYPYDAKANPSGFPFLFMLALPFYLLGDNGYLVVFGVILFLVLLKNSSTSAKELFTRLIILLVLPVFYYEYLVRSELFTNMTLFIAAAAIALKKLDIEKRDTVFWALAILFGLLLSTWLVVFISYSLLVLFLFRKRILNGVLFGLISAVSFFMTLLPFIMWNPDYFWNKGPFAIQFLYLPLWVIILASIFLLYIGWMLRDAQELMFASGVTIFTLVAISFLIKVAEYGFYFCVIESGYDISYFAMTVPFLLLSICEYRVDRYLGKLID